MLRVPGKGDLQVEPPGGVDVEPEDHALGRSRGGFSTKTHLAAEQGRKPLSLVVTAGQRGDSPQFEVVLDGIRVARVGSVHSDPAPDDYAYHLARVCAEFPTTISPEGARRLARLLAPPESTEPR